MGYNSPFYSMNISMRARLAELPAEGLPQLARRSFTELSEEQWPSKATASVHGGERIAGKTTNGRPSNRARASQLHSTIALLWRCIRIKSQLYTIQSIYLLIRICARSQSRVLHTLLDMQPFQAPVFQSVAFCALLMASGFTNGNEVDSWEHLLFSYS